MFPKLGETIIAEKYELFGGGKGANQAASMGKLGLNVQMFGKTGDDIYGKLLMESLKKCNVNIENVITGKTSSTGAAFIIVDKIGNNTIVITPGANGTLSMKDIESFKMKILKNDIIVLQMEIPKDIVSNVINMAKESKKIVLLNLAPALNMENNILNKVDFLVLNELEVEYLTKVSCSIQNLNLALKKIREFYHNKLIITLGPDGAAYSISSNDFKIIPTFNVTTVDGTGAGDAFIGGFTYGLVKNKNIEDCATLGNAAGAFSTTKVGAQSSFPNKEELEDFLKLKEKDRSSGFNQ